MGTTAERFWHKPEGAVQWHLYDPNKGAAFCQRFCLIGCGMPRDARKRTPIKACPECVRRAERNKGATMTAEERKP